MFSKKLLRQNIKLNKFNIFKRYASNITKYLTKQYLAPSLNTFRAFKNKTTEPKSERPLKLEIVKGDMQYLYDEKNNQLLDMLGNNLCVSVGHCNPEVNNSLIKQMNRLVHCTTMYYNRIPARLAQHIVKLLPERSDGDEYVVHFVNSGTEAVNLAIEMAREATNSLNIIGLEKAYHGTMGSSARLTSIGISTRVQDHNAYPGFHHVPANNIEILEHKIKYGLGGHLAAFALEPLQGFGGIFPLDKNYTKQACELIRKHDGLIIADEIQTGFGRLGTHMWGFQRSEFEPDIITIAKSMGNGLPIGAVISTKKVANKFTEKMFFTTYGSNPLVCAGSLKTLKIMQRDNLMENCLQRGLEIEEGCNKLIENYPTIYKEIRGSGLFRGLEINGRTPVEKIDNAVEIQRQLLTHGILVGIGSAQRDVVRMQSPMIINSKNVQHFLRTLDLIGNNMT